MLLNTYRLARMLKCLFRDTGFHQRAPKLSRLSLQHYGSRPIILLIWFLLMEFQCHSSDIRHGIGFHHLPASFIYWDKGYWLLMLPADFAPCSPPPIWRSSSCLDPLRPKNTVQVLQRLLLFTATSASIYIFYLLFIPPLQLTMTPIPPQSLILTRPLMMLICFFHLI
jgi:hypothetical protein